MSRAMRSSDLCRYEQQGIVLFAHLPGRQALRRIVSTYPASADDLTELFTNPDHRTSSG